MLVGKISIIGKGDICREIQIVRVYEPDLKWRAKSGDKVIYGESEDEVQRNMMHEYPDCEYLIEIDYTMPEEPKQHFGYFGWYGP